MPVHFAPNGRLDRAAQQSALLASLDGGLSWAEIGATEWRAMTKGRCKNSRGSAAACAADEHSSPGMPRAGALVHPAVARTAGSTLVAFFASTTADHIYRAHAFDAGERWSEPVRTALPSNAAPLAALTLRSGNVALLFNNVGGEGARWPLSIALSLDAGMTWPYVRDLEPHKESHTANDEPLARMAKLRVAQPRPRFPNNGGALGGGAGAAQRFTAGGGAGMMRKRRRRRRQLLADEMSKSTIGEHTRWGVGTKERGSAELTAREAAAAVEAARSRGDADGVWASPSPPPPPPAVTSADGVAASSMGEYASPALVQTSDGMVHVVFAALRETVMYARFPESFIRHGSTIGEFKGGYSVGQLDPLAVRTRAPRTRASALVVAADAAAKGRDQEPVEGSETDADDSEPGEQLHEEKFEWTLDRR